MNHIVELFRSGSLVLLTIAMASGTATAQARGTASSPMLVDYESARFDRRLWAVRIASPVTVDGVLDEAAWQVAAVADNFVQNEPREGAPGTYDTRVRVLYDDEALYIGVFASDPEPDRLIVSDLKKDFNAASGDAFRVILDTFRDGRNGYEFATNPAGAKWDAQVANEGREINANWDAVWEVRTRVADDGWCAEFRIPLRSLKFKNADPQTWGINFERKLRRLNEDSHWSPLPRIYGLERVSLAGSLEGMQRLRSGKSIQVKPYALTSSNTVAQRRTDGQFDVGVDVKYAVTTSLTWDFTVNTDFSQVEADEQQINLSRVSLFFPEKRDFFVENSGIFQFGGGGLGDIAAAAAATNPRQNAPQEMLLFFSRRIGLSDRGEPIPILAGTRLSGRVRRSSIGILNVQQRSQVGVPSTNVAVVRVRRDVLANSDIGGVFMDKEQTGHFNRVAGADANFRFGFLSLNGYIAKTFVPQVRTTNRGGNLALRGSVTYRSPVWTLEGRFSSIGARFNNELGFVPRQGVDNVRLVAARSFRPRRTRDWLRVVAPSWQVDAFVRPDGSVESRYQDTNMTFLLQSGTLIKTGVNTNVEDIRSSFVINSVRNVSVPPGRYEFKEHFVVWNSNAAAPVSWIMRYSNGRFYDGYHQGYLFGPTIRLNEHANISAALQINRIVLPHAAFASRLMIGRINYNINTKMFLNALLQYNTDLRQWSSNVRFNFIHRPLSDLFLVYNEGRDERTATLLNRSIVAKLTYLMAF